MSRSSKKIFTLGTSNRSLQEFLEILNCYGIQVVIDVRRWPTSHFPYFKKENLEKILKERRIEYHYFQKLGGYRTAGYQAYTKTKDFKESLSS